MTAVAGLLGLGADAVFDAAGQWMATGATWILQQLVTVVSATTATPLGTAWFTGRLGVMAGIGAALALPLACCAAVQAVLRQSPGLLVRAVAINLPVALVCTGTATALVRMGLAVTDALSNQVLGAAGTSAGGALAPVSAGFGVATGAPGFAVLLGAVVVAVAGLTLWLEMAVRSAAVSLAVLFLPLVMAAMVWPAIGHWCRRLAETLAGLVLSKLVVVAALALAAQALGNGLGSPAGGGGFGAVVTGAALLVVAASSPFALLRLIPAVEAGAVAQLEQARHHLRQAPQAAWRFGTDMGRLAAAGAADAAGLGPIGPLASAGDGGPGGSAPEGPGSSGPGWGGPDPVGPGPGGPGAPPSGGGPPGAGDRPPGRAGLRDMDTGTLAAYYEDAMEAGVADRHLDDAVARRADGMSPAEANAPYLPAGTPDPSGAGHDPSGPDHDGSGAAPARSGAAG